jgi:predicted dehydrogenase
MLRTAVVGLGWWGRHLVGNLARSDLMRVVATVDPDPRQRADRRRLAEVLDDRAVDAVVLCIPHSQHADAIVRCAAAGKHVFCEKPLTLTAASATTAVDACRRAGVVLAVGHERRFDDVTRLVRDELEAGRLGTVLLAEVSMSHDRFLGLPADHWRGSEHEAPAAGMTGMGVHLTDALISFFGAVEEVVARTAQRVLALPSGDVVAAELRFVDGTLGLLSAVSATPFYGRLALFGSHGWIEVRDDDHPETGAGATVTTFRRGERPRARHVTPETDAVLANLEAFAAAAAGGPAYPIPDVELIHNVAVLEAIARSARTGAPVTVGEGVA